MVDRTIRVLITTDAVGGVWQYTTELAQGLSLLGVEIVLAILGPSPNERQLRDLRANPDVKLLDTGLPLDWLSSAEATQEAARGIAVLAKREQVDIVHLNSPALAADQMFSVPVLGVAHGCVATWWQAARPGQPLDPSLRWHESMMERGLRACDQVLAPSASYAATVCRHYQLGASPVVVHNGRTLPPMRGRTFHHDCALTAGRLWDEVKNTRALDAAAQLLPFPFHAAGPITAPHGATVSIEHLHLLGQLDAASLEHRLSDQPVFVSAATFEPFGLAVLEAAARGCPLVLSDIPTFRELWEGAAIFVVPDDPCGFAHAITECVEDLPLRARLSQAAQTQAQRYSAERMASAIAAHYSALLGTRLAA